MWEKETWYLVNTREQMIPWVLALEEKCLISTFLNNNPRGCFSWERKYFNFWYLKHISPKPLDRCSLALWLYLCLFGCQYPQRILCFYLFILLWIHDRLQLFPVYKFRVSFYSVVACNCRPCLFITGPGDTSSGRVLDWSGGGWGCREGWREDGREGGSCWLTPSTFPLPISLHSRQ